MAFMQPQVYEGTYFQIETTAGTETVPADLVHHQVGVSTKHNSLASDAVAYLEGTPINYDEVLVPKNGWLARMSAPGFLDCTSWSAHETEDEAKAFLTEMYDCDEPETQQAE